MNFEVLVVGPDIGRQLGFWGQRTRLSPYRVRVDQAELDYEQRLLREDPEPGVDADDPVAVIRYSVGEDLHAGSGVGRDDRGWYYWSTRNWKARWDRWTIGPGQSLLTKPGGAVVRPEAWHDPWPEVLRRPDAWQRAEPGQVLRGAQSRAAEVDFAAMHRDALGQAGRRWNAWQATDRAGRVEELEELQVGGFTREQFLARAGGCPPFLVQDGRWYERGDLGLRADVSDERAAQWQAFVDMLVERLDGDTPVTIVECHT